MGRRDASLRAPGWYRGATGGNVALDSGGGFSVTVDTQGRATDLSVTITATDWSGNVQTSTLTLTVPKDITSFVFERAHNANLPFEAVGTVGGTTIEVRVAAGTVRTALVVSFSHTGASVKVGSVEQQSGVTPNDFTSTAMYTVVGRDNKTKTYTVSVVEVTADYGQAAAPAFDPAPGTYRQDIAVSLSTTTPGGVIYYTTDGNDPTASSTRYAGPITIDATSVYRVTETLKAVAFAPGYTPSALSAGVFTVNYPWEPQAYLKPPNAEGWTCFGGSVAVSGDTVVVGAQFENSNQTTITNGPTASGAWSNSAQSAGAAYIFVRAAGNWSRQAYLKTPNAEAHDGFACSVAISGDTVIAGAYGEDSCRTTITNDATASNGNSADTAGAAYVFVRSAGTWSQQTYLKAPNADAGGLFGFSVAVSGETVVVGARWEDSGQTTITNGTSASADNSATDAGAAYVFFFD